MRYLIDTNVLLRFLRGDDSVLSPKAKVLFDLAGAGECTLVVTDLVLAEAVWVLTSFYKTDREDIVDALLPIVAHPSVETTNPAVVLDALKRFRSSRIDFTDCLLGAQAAASDTPVASFDADFGKLEGVRWVRPGDGR